MSTITTREPMTAPGSPSEPASRLKVVASPAAWLVWGAVVLFMVFLVGIVGSVLVNSFGTRWFDTWLPQGWTVQWYSQAWTDFGLFQVVIVTLEVAAAVVALSVLIGVPASYVLARRNFPGKKLVYFAFLLPIMMPPITYGIPLATVLYKFNLAGNITGVILANLVPCVPFVILTMTPAISRIALVIASNEYVRVSPRTT
jgi:putative spermidine/putrescine transport system permease protein